MKQSKQTKEHTGRETRDRTRGHSGRAAPTTTASLVWALPWLPPAAITLLVVVLGVDVLRIGFFADDFHFLDVAQRVPLSHALSGQFGIYPWYRPLSREMYFALVAAAGPSGILVAHLLSLACVGGIAWQVRQFGLRLAGPRVAAIAPVLFLTAAITEFLTAWPSGFQDLLALLLVMLALRAQLEGRSAWAVAWAFLAPFAKETAVLVFPILALMAVLYVRERRVRPWMIAQLAAFAGATGIHLAVRLLWHTGGSESHVVRSLPALAASLVRVGSGFLGLAPLLEPVPVLLALIAAAAATALLVGAAAPRRKWPPVPTAPAGEDARAGAATGRAVAFVAATAALCLAPLLVGHALSFLSAYDYYAFPAVPWLALLLAMAIARLPRKIGAVAVAAIVAWNTAARGDRAPDLSSPQAWEFHNWDWAEAVRLSAISRRLAEDVRSNLASRPESLVVLYCDISRGSYFQTEDGPATRLSLQDRTVRAFWLNASPFGLRPGAFRILSFDHETRHLEPYSISAEQRGGLAATAVATGNAPAAWVFASYGDSVDNAQFQFGYFRAAAALMAEGVNGALRELDALGLADTSGPEPGRRAEDLFGRGSMFYEPMAGVLRHPLDARAHLRLADCFRAQEAAISEAVELRIATTLDPRLGDERLRLARVLVSQHLDAAARREIEPLVATAAGTPIEAEARRLLRQLSRADTVGVNESPILDFQPR